MANRARAASVTVLIAFGTAACGHTPANGLLNSVAALWSPKSEASASAKAQPTVYGARSALSDPNEAPHADKPPSPAPVAAKPQAAPLLNGGAAAERKSTTAISTSAVGAARGADGKAKTAGPDTVTVTAGDTLLKIAEQHRVSVSALMAANRLQSLTVTPGQQLVIPAR